MKVHPLFVPVEGEHVAATISLPETSARDLAVLLQGFGVTRSHRNRLWTRMSMALAERGIASVRLDYPGMGESTGPRPAGMDNPPIQAVAAVTRLALDVAGVESYSVVGNCLGAQSALLIAERIPGCRGVGLILPGNLEGIVQNGSPHRGSSKLNRIVRAVPPLRRLAGVIARRRTGTIRLIPEVENLLGSMPMLFLFMGPEEMWHRLVRELSGPIRRAGPLASDRVERVFVPIVGSYGLRPLASQEAVIQVVPDWVDRVTSLLGRPARSTPQGLPVVETESIEIVEPVGRA